MLPGVQESNFCSTEEATTEEALTLPLIRPYDGELPKPA
jgi:hypothetical protein